MNSDGSCQNCKSVLISGFWVACVIIHNDRYPLESAAFVRNNFYIIVPNHREEHGHVFFAGGVIPDREICEGTIYVIQLSLDII